MGDSTATTCRCSRPTRDTYTVCDTCTDTLSVALGEIPWLDDELETTITRQKGVTYNGSGGKGGKKPTDMPSPVHWGASEAKSHLKAVLVSWVKFCADEQIRNASPQYGLPADNLPAISRWLMWRVDGLALHDIGADAVEEITDAVTACHRKIDRAPDKRFYGRCTCGEWMYAHPSKTHVTCQVCSEGHEVSDLNLDMWQRAMDQLVTADEARALLGRMGVEVSRATLYRWLGGWTKHNRLISHDSNEGKRYAFRDIAALVENQAAA